MKTAWLAIVLALAAPLAVRPAAAADKLMPGARVFVHPMNDDFDTYLKTALGKKKVPVVVVPSREEADYEIKGSAESQKASAAKKLVMGSWHSDEQASISVSGIKSGEIVFAYSANKKNSKHLKEAIEKGK